MNAACPQCHAAVLPEDRFCPECGQKLSTGQESAEATDVVHPLPTGPTASTPAPERRYRRTRRYRRPWYRRLWALLLLGFVTVVIAATIGTWAFVNARFSELNEVSTPAPEVSSDLLGGDTNGVIDTGPAQEAVRRAEANGRSSETESATSDEEVLAAGTLEPFGATEAGEASTPPEDNASTAAATSPRPGSTAALVVTASPPPVRASSPNTVTILLMGVDARPGEPIDINVRPDTLAVLHLDGQSGSCRLLSIPRDTRTELPGYGPSKVNHALAVGGIPYQVLVTGNLLGIELDHYGLIDMGGITGLVDAVGGVTVINDVAFEHLGFVFDAGEITLDGEEALAYARYRGGPDGDFGRIARQQDIVRALVSETSGMDIVTGAYDLLGAVDGHIKTDMSPTDLIGLANGYRSTCTEATLETDNLDGTVGTFPDALLGMDLSFVVVDPAEIDDKIDWLTGDE